MLGTRIILQKISFQNTEAANTMYQNSQKLLSQVTPPPNSGVFRPLHPLVPSDPDPKFRSVSPAPPPCPKWSRPHLARENQDNKIFDQA